MNRTASTSASRVQSIILEFSLLLFSLAKRLHFSLVAFFRFPKRSELPATLFEWKLMGIFGEEEDEGKLSMIWGMLDAFFEQHGLTPYRRNDDHNQSTTDLPAPSNYVYIPVNKANQSGKLCSFSAASGVLNAFRKDNRHYIVRVVSAGGQGLDSLHVLRLLSRTFPYNLYSNNHILPMVEEIVYKDITFGVFPLAFGRLQEALNTYLSRSTVEDVLNLIMQALEGIIYIHGKNIAHRDLYSDNFLIDFLPESLVAQCWTRPRVYLSDFETAIHFPDETKPSERLVSGYPFLYLGRDLYGRKPAPELLVSDTHMYCPFKMDMFQFGTHLMVYLSDTGFVELDSLWPQLLSENPNDRLTAHEVFVKLGDFISSTPPKVLQKTWTVVPPFE